MVRFQTRGFRSRGRVPRGISLWRGPCGGRSRGRGSSSSMRGEYPGPFDGRRGLSNRGAVRGRGLSVRGPHGPIVPTRPYRGRIIRGRGPSLRGLPNPPQPTESYHGGTIRDCGPAMHVPSNPSTMHMRPYHRGISRGGHRVHSGDEGYRERREARESGNEWEGENFQRRDVRIPQERDRIGGESSRRTSGYSDGQFESRGNRRRHNPDEPEPGAPAKQLRRETNPMGTRMLRRLQSEEPPDILQQLFENLEPLQLLLSGKMSDDNMKLFIDVLSKMCKASDQSSERAKDILLMVHKKSFLEGKLAIWISKWEVLISTKEECEKNVLLIVDIMSNMLREVQEAVPSIGVVVILLNNTIKRYEEDGISDEVVDRLATLSEERSRFLLASGEEQSANSYSSPPDNFREIPILPLSCELREDYRPFLRTNIVNEKYQDVNHYLDVHFRLLREDFVQPLREGIAEYTADLTRGRGKAKKHFQNMRLYTAVHAVSINTSENGLSVVLQFDVENHLKNVRWGISKRLIFGSLVCLSKDNFTTLLFGVVSNRSLDDLRRGKIEVNFVLRPEQALELFSHTFIMAESSSYFEAYRYILRCLQIVGEKSFPFTEYVINMARSPTLPKYLNTENCTYDLSSLVMKQQESSISQNSKKICVNSDVGWPSAEVMGLDASQMVAYKSALTQEFCLIQGPPGTGKTYVGLKIVKTFLKNKEFWGPRKPLLVVCYTNHALDQFLEGILQFDTHVVRIGGRSKNEMLKNLNVNQITRDARKTGPLKHIISALLGKMRSLALDASNYQPLIAAASKKLIKIEVLQNVMTKEHRESLRRLSRSSHDPIPSWLNLYDECGELIPVEVQLNQSNMDDCDVSKVPLNFSGASKEEGELDDFPDITNGFGSYGYTSKSVQDANQSEFAADDDNEKEEGEIENDESDDDYFESRFLDDSDERFDQPNDIPIHEPVDIVVPFPDAIMKSEQNVFLDEYIKTKLSENDIMTQEEANDVKNVWDLNNVQDRWRLYRYWIHSYTRKIHQKFHGIFAEYNKSAAKLKELRTEEKYRALKNTSVIGVTTTGAAKYNHLLKRIGPPIVIVEEAAEILEAHVMTSLNRKTQHLILIGDHQQLRPNPTVYKLCKDFKLDVSLFERMVNNEMPCHRLSLQHRMRPEISHILKLHKDFYPGLQDHEIVQNYDHILGVEKDVFFVNHKVPEQRDTESKSRSNIHEATFLTALCKYLLQQGYSANQITILTAYKGQVHVFKQIMDRHTFEGVRVCPVDNFQGEENDIILFSFVRSNIEGNIGFLKVSNRICVALSRAKKGLYCIGDFSMMSEQSEVWRTINDDLQARGLIGPSLKLLCSNHPEKFIEASCGQDFRKVPDGGCQEYCNVRLNCGHSCQKRCHPRDKEHRDMPCYKPCEKLICDKDHRCPLTCSEPCAKYCKKKVTKKLPCGHEEVTFCSKNPEDVECSNPCDKQLPCGHDCKRRCYEPCEQDCKEKVQKTFVPCGHKAFVSCYQTECPEPCRTLLQCDHQCQGTCGKCDNGRYHVKCTRKCERILVCGHSCKSRCSQVCPPCKKTCENRCEHNRCQKMCGERCMPCRERCEWSCIHQKCSRHCGEECDRERCNKPCRRILKCRHKCIGLCGEPCPKLCRTCDEDEVTRILFGDEDEPDARFISLENCNHIVEVNALDKLMEGNKGSEENEIKLPECPWCKTPIRYSKRYNSVLNAYRRDVEAVKEKIKGEENKIRSTCSQLQRRLFSSRSRTLITHNNLGGFHKKSTFDGYELSMQFREAFDRLESYIRRPTYLLSTEDLVTVKINLDMYDMVLELGKFEIKDLDNSKEELEIVDSCERFCESYKFLVQKTKEQMLERSAISEQEIHDWQREFNRCRLALDMTKVDVVFQKSKINLDDHEKEKKMVAEVNQLLAHKSPFTQDKEEQVRAHLEHLKTFDPDLQKMGITLEEKDMIIKAMAFNRRGHWFKCPNGHVYAIGECGGATQRSVCPECKANIGGESHHLDESNKLAPEMDGASFAAYSEEANNLNNFVLVDII